jgi:glycosyltransferase involved in cell wall biosynthesis
MMPKNLLIVAPFFSPSASIGAKRSIKLALRIGAQGWKPHVLTISESCCQSKDASAPVEQLQAAASITRVPCWSMWRHSRWWEQSRPGLPRFFSRIHRGIAKATEWMLPTNDWWPWTVTATKRGVSIVKEHDIDMIWASAPPVGALDLARRISRKTGVPYVADIRDVSVSQDTPELAKKHRKLLLCERKALGEASGVTYVAPHQIELLKNLHPCAVDLPHRLIYNWFDQAESDLIPTHSFKNPTILHGGSLYGGHRRLDAFMEALSGTIREHSAAGDLRFVNHGPAGDHRYLRDEATRCGVTEAVDLAESISSKSFAERCRGATILLLVVGRTTLANVHAQAIPGKLFDYFAAGRPILVVGPKDCQAGLMVERLNRGIATPDDNPELIGDAIAKLLRGYGVSDKLDLSSEAVSEFESICAVRNMADFLRSVCDSSV